MTEAESVGAIELALQATIDAEPVEARIRAAEKDGKFAGNPDANVRDIAQGMREAVSYFVELSKLGHQISHVDVGGGHGVDYEGTRSRSFC